VPRVQLPSSADLALVATHIATRLTVWLVYLLMPYPWRSLAWGDVFLYHDWAGQIAATGAAPDIVSWMYPPGAAAFIVGVLAIPLGYPWAFIICLVIVDIAILLLLLHRDGHRGGAWAWAVLPPALGGITWARLDLLPVAAAAAAVLWAERRPRLAGAIAAVGTAIKAWPVLLGVLFLRNRRWLAAAVLTGGGLTAVATLALDGAWDFVARLSGRGVQVESVLATPWLVRQAFDASIDGDFVNGSYEILGPGTAIVARIGSILVVLLVAVAWWVSRGWHPAVRWWAMVMALLSASPLLSTQFVLWIIGACAVAATLRGPDGDIARRALPAIAVITVLSHLGFPVQWGDLTNGEDNLAAFTVASRNIILVATTVWLLVSLRRRRPPAPPTAAPSVEQPRRPTTTAAPPPPARQHRDGPHAPVTPASR